jgi:glutathione S-transferase
MAVVLRYFDAQGRAQALRHALSDVGLSFEDVRVTLATWPPLREDPSFGGWFASLPTLTWDTDTVSETLSIASYVARRSGHYDGLGVGEIAKLEAVVSCSYLDVVRGLADVVWAPSLYPGADVATTTPRQLRWSLAAAPVGVATEWRCRGRRVAGGSRPTVAFFSPKR